jgi:chaperone BCS1
MAIAGHFSLGIYILNLSTISEDNLRSLFAKLPSRCLVLLEDIDAVRSKRSLDTETENSRHLVTSSRFRKSESVCGKVSLSALLNLIDGVGSSEGRILIMTTNHISRLDEALIRPGRVDKKVELGLADKEMITQLFFVIFKRSKEDVPGLGKQFEDDKTVERLAREFAAKVPKLEFSPAEVQSFLLAYKQSPRQAVDNVEAWMTRIREEREEARNEVRGSC